MIFSELSSKNYEDFRAAKREFSQKYLKPAKFIGHESVAGVKRKPMNRNKRMDLDPRQNIVGVGVGEKITDCARTGDLAVKFYVRVKCPEQRLSKNQRLPKKIAGLPVDVEESGTFRAFSLPDPRQLTRPAQPGNSIGFAEPLGRFEMAGTFGALVGRQQEVFILSNNHVLADENRLPAGSNIFQPGLLDGGVFSGNIARLAGAVTLDPTVFNKVDAAIALVNDINDVSNEVLFIGAPTGTRRAELGTIVHKFGRTTEYTIGMITDVAADISVRYETGEYYFDDQIVITGLMPFSASGDSGSLILDYSTGEAVGLLFGGTGTHTVANHIDDVLSALNVALV